MNRFFSFLLLLACGFSAAAEEFHVYFGTYTRGESRGIYRSRFDSKEGTLTSPELAAEIQNPSFLAMHPSAKTLYAAGELDSGGSVTAFSVNATSGALTRLNQESSGGRGPCHVSINHAGTAALVANYGGGSISLLPLRPDGTIAPASSTIQHNGSSVHSRQAAAHAHFITASPDDRFAHVCDLGLDQIVSYSFRAASNSDPIQLSSTAVQRARTKPGAGPRHLAFSPDGKCVYVINELNNTVSVFHYDSSNGAMSEVQSISSLPESFTSESTAAGIAVHPSGKFVYASNRGHDSIAVFAVEPAGKLRFVAHQTAGIRTPRHFVVDPTGHWMLVENQSGNSVVVFGIDLATGTLKRSSNSMAVASPVCAVFVRCE
ncbi:MAG TPA: lactonase family protein [Verrucomicrobiae bacterium]|nr:lactonase family protein [Verrucomicrobiae bacterium]